MRNHYENRNNASMTTFVFKHAFDFAIAAWIGLGLIISASSAAARWLGRRLASRRLFGRPRPQSLEAAILRRDEVERLVRDMRRHGAPPSALENAIRMLQLAEAELQRQIQHPPITP